MFFTVIFADLILIPIDENTLLHQSQNVWHTLLINVTNKHINHLDI